MTVTKYCLQSDVAPVERLLQQLTRDFVTRRISGMPQINASIVAIAQFPLLGKNFSPKDQMRTVLQNATRSTEDSDIVVVTFVTSATF